MTQPLLFIAGTSLTQSRSHRAQHIARYFMQRNFQIDIVGAINFREELKDMSNANLSEAPQKNLSLIRIEKNFHARQITVRKLPKLSGYLQSLWFYTVLYRHLEKSYAIGIIGHPDHAYLAQLLKRSKRIGKLVYDDWDYFPPVATSLVEKQQLEREESWFIKEADAVVSVSPNLAELRRRQGARKTMVIPNGVNLSFFQKAAQSQGGEALDHRLSNAQGKIVNYDSANSNSFKAVGPILFYMGNLGRIWGVDVAIKVMPLVLVKYPSARLHITGYGLEEAELREQVHQFGLDGAVKFLGTLDYQALLLELRKATIGLAPYRPHTFSDYSAPQKIVEYMASGLPVVATCQGYAKYCIEQSRAGLAVEATPEAFAQAIFQLLENPLGYGTYMQNAIEFSKRYDWEILLNDYCKMLEGL